MGKKKALVILFFMCVLVSNVIAAGASDADSGRYIVKFRDGARAKSSAGIDFVKELQGPEEEVFVIEGNKEELLLMEDVVSVEEDYLVRALSETPWNFQAIGVDFSDIPADSGEGVKIVVLDTGVDYNLLDVQSGYDFVNEDNDAFDDAGHGTFISQLYKSPGTGMPLPAADVYAVKVLDENGEGYVSDVIEGVYWAIDNEADIVSMSFGSDGDSFDLRTAIFQGDSGGVLFVGAVGNENGKILYPAAYPEVVAAGSVNQNIERSGFSNYGQELELMAPGEDVVVTDGINDYPASGTSFSVPHVGAVAGLVFAEHPGISNHGVRAILQETALDLGDEGKDEYYGFGIVYYSTANFSSEIEELEQRVSALESWKGVVDAWRDVVTGTIDEIWLAIAELTATSQEHETRIAFLEEQSKYSHTGGNETFPFYLNYFGSGDRKKIVCGYAEDEHLETIEELGYNCTVSYRQTSRGERARCRCKKV